MLIEFKKKKRILPSALGQNYLVFCFLPTDLSSRIPATVCDHRVMSRDSQYVKGESALPTFKRIPITHYEYRVSRSHTRHFSFRPVPQGLFLIPPILKFSPGTKRWWKTAQKATLTLWGHIHQYGDFVFH